MWVLITVILIIIIVLFYIIYRNKNNSSDELSDDVDEVVSGDDPLSSDTDKTLDCVGSFYSEGENPNVSCKKLLSLNKETYKSDITSLKSKHSNVTVPKLKDYLSNLDQIVKYSYLKSSSKPYTDPGFMVDYPLDNVGDDYLRYKMAMYNFYTVLSNFYQRLYILNCSETSEYKNIREVIQTLPLGSRADGINYPDFYSDKLDSVEVSTKLQTGNYINPKSRSQSMLFDYLRFKDKMSNSDPMIVFLQKIGSPNIEDWGETVLTKDEICAFLYGMMIFNLNLAKGNYFELHTRLRI